jgi:malonyl-CoA/methylmalonyl-CoA synthetase
VPTPGDPCREPHPGWRPHVPAGATFTPDDLLAERSLVAAWSRTWAADPERPVLHTSGHGWTTGADLDERSRRAAARLHGAGVRAGDRVVLSGPNSLHLVVAHVAALRLGAVVVPVNGAYREREVAHIVTDADPTVAIVDQPEWGAWIRRASARAAITDSSLDGLVGSSDSRPRARSSPELDRAAPGDPAIIGYTSGTTGAPKGAVLTHGNVLAGAASVRVAWRWSRDDRLVLCLPLFHMHGLGVGLHGTLLAGASAVLLDGFEVDVVLDAVREHGATLFFGVPTMYHRLAASERVAELAPLRLCVAGSAALPAALHRRLEDAAGVRVLERYGMTETVMLVSNPYDGERRAGTVGFPLPGVELRIAAVDAAGDREPLASEPLASEPPAGVAGVAGVAGEIEVRGPNVFAGYWNRPDATSVSFTSDGWFRTGDVGEVDADGYVRIVGRSKELIISGGFNVHPREVEDVLAEHPAIAEVAVAGRPSAEWGEEVTAFVVPRTGTTAPRLEELREWARSQLAPYKLPRALVVVDSLPRNALGKVVKGDLP